MKDTLRTQKRKYLLLSLVLALITLAAGTVFLRLGTGNTFRTKAEESVDTYNIYNADDLNTYATAYAEGDRNKFDTLNFLATNGDYLSDENYVSIGTQARPFSGTIYITTTGLDTFYLYDVPLFDYVSTEMTVTGTGIIKIKKHESDGVLFANHVVKTNLDKNGEESDGEAEWNISFEEYDGIGENDCYAGLIGDIGDGCDVTINYTVNDNLKIVSGGNAGLVCGTLGNSTGAKLTVSTDGTATGVSVTAANGNAGGLVGEAKEDSDVVLNDVSSTIVNSVAAGGGGHYAGGIVGKLSDTEISFGNDFAGITVSGSVTGTEGAGGLFGYYRSENKAATSLFLANYTINSGLTVSSSGNSGGIIGVLDNDAATFTYDGNAESATITVTGSSYCGGVIGFYSTDDLANTLRITNVNNSVTKDGSGVSGGLIGGIADSAAYVLIDGETGAITTNSNAHGGLVGIEGSGGSFIDVKGSVTVSGSHGGGLVGTMYEGVLRLEGDTHLENAAIDAVGGVIVKTRGRSLIYALGSGTDYDGSDPQNVTGWSITRKSTVEADDIYSWGNVVRVGTANFTESDLFTVNMTAHTVQVGDAATSMGTKAAFAKTALNIQLNNAAAKGALRFSSAYNGTSGSATLLKGNLSLSANIDMSDTGITGLTRDNGANAVYTGSTFSGNGYTITLDTGAGFGVQYNQGGVHNHAYVGLFAKAGTTGAGVTFSNLTVAGTMNIRPKGDVSARYVGAVVAYVENKVNLTSVTASPTITLNCLDGAWAYVGSAVGNVHLNGKVIVSGGTYGATVTDNTAVGGDAVVFGGVIGNTEGSATADSEQEISIGNDAALIASYTKTEAFRVPLFGAAIGRIEHAKYDTAKRTVTINDVDVSFTASATPSNRKIGGILGAEWYAANVTVTDLRIDNTHITANGSADMGGLVQTATGHWDVVSLSVDADNDGDVVIAASSNSTFGFMANKAYRSGDTAAARSALYLDVDNTGSNYDIAKLTVNNAGNFTVFDELVADSRFGENAITSNGNAIISVTTTDGAAINFDDTDCNTYQNKTTAGKAHGKHGNTRYYYNLKAIRTAVSPDAAQKFLIWSVKTYAHASLSGWFTDDVKFTGSSFTGSLDMTGLSYYPVDLNGASVTFRSVALTLDNNGIEAAEGYNGGSTDSIVRGTRTSGSQHYLMHTSTFKNVVGRISINNSFTVSGNVPRLNNGEYCGFLIAETLGGTGSGVVTHEDAVSPYNGTSGITFDGAYITVDGAHLNDDAYAPLFINKVLRNSTVNIVGASQSNTAYADYNDHGYYAASSLIGDVGDANATSIRLSFEKLKFDGRIDEIPDGTGTTNAKMNSSDWYGTERSIFSRATILNSFLNADQSSGQSSGIYNFTWADDWTDSAHNVTYGWEIKGSVENAGNQEKYYADANRYVDPTSNNNTSGVYAGFTDAYFLPYVYLPRNLDLKQHELAVNIFVAVGNITGCGKYGDPYVITDGNMLNYVSNVINGSVTDTVTGLTLPSDIADPDTAVAHSGTPGTDYDVVYKYNGSGYFTAAGKDNVSLDAVRLYLAGAYYQIKAAKIELPTNFSGLGVPNNDDANPEYYAFRGVIVGHPDYDNVISNASAAPLIYTSNGCVVKDVTVEVNCATTIAFNYASYTGSFEYRNGSKAYGAVIGQVMGGDTIIDNVSVTYTTATFSFNDTVYTRLAPIGGYIGVVLNGGVVFRNMAGKVPTNFADKLDRVSDEGYLYVNPIIGRVIAGYAFHETDAYHCTETTSTLKNTNKNYSIPDFNATPSNTLNVSGNKINVYDGQSLFILSLIVNSGAGAASSDAGDYDDLSGCWQAYRAYCATRGTASYNDLGNESTDYDASTSDGYAGLNRTPYVIAKYSTSDARTVSSNVDKTVEICGNCELPESFRGIGSIYINNPLVRIRANYFRGHNNTQYEITLNTRYVEYNIDRSDGNLSYKFYYESKNYGYWEETSVRSIGIINQFIATTSTGNITLNVSNLKLAGSVYVDLRNRETGAAFTEYLFSSLANGGNNKNDTPLAAPASNGIGGINGVSVTVGGFVGCVYNNSRTPTVNFTNIDFDGISVQGPKWAGGLVGAGRGAATVSFTNCDTINGNVVTVKAGHQAGGLIGRSRQITVNVNSSSGSSTLQIGEIVCMGKTSGATINDVTYTSANHDNAPGDGSGQNEESYSCGGVTAYARQNALTVKNLTLTGGYIKHEVMANDDKVGFAGGVLGHSFQPNFTFNNVTVRGVNFDAEVVGGLIGGIASNLQAACYVNNCTVDGQGSATIQGRNKAGGVFGIVQIGQNGRSIEISSTTVKRYTISQTYEITSGSNYASAGGLCAHVLFADNTVSLKLFDDSVTECTVSSAYTAASTGRGTGGLIGVVTGYGKNVNGYDLFLDDTVILGNADRGVFVGKNNANCVFKLVGVSYKDVYSNSSKTVAFEADSAEFARLYANGSGKPYVVFADYAGATSTNGFSPINNSANVNSGTAVYPFVTTNPSVKIGVMSGPTDLVLTGDGAALTVESLPVKAILQDGKDGKYFYAANNAYSGSISDKNYDVFNSYANKFSLFSREALGYNPAGENVDFPVLVIDSNDSDTVTKMLNAYLRLLTDTRLSFADSTDQSNYNFAVNFYCVSYSGSNFTCSPISSSLVTCAYQKFVITRDYFDSGKNQFMLIEVAFKNPADTNKIAYHLYLPVFVQRVLNYRFDVAVRSGTGYIERDYSPYYGDMLIENVGSPVTVYFKYTYQRTAEEWLSFINEGENIHRNFTKSLEFRKANENAVLDLLPDDTILVLVDPNSGESYYSDVGTAVSDGMLNLSAFTSVMGKTGSTVTFSGTSFAPQNLDALMNGTLAVVENNSGPLVACAENVATVKIGEGYYCPYESGEGQRYSAVIVADSITASESGAYVPCTVSSATVKHGTNYYRPYVDGDEGTRYDVTVRSESIGSYKFSERYYISIFTEASTNFHRYVITAPHTFGDSDHPSVISDTGAHTMVHLIMGRIFDHSGFSVTSTSRSGDYVMTADNNRLIITMQSTMGVSSSLGSLRNEVKQFVGATNVYQSFIVYLNRKAGGDPVKAILGDPTAYDSYYVVGGGSNVYYDDNDEETHGDLGEIRITQNGAEFVTGDLASVFAVQDTFTVSAHIVMEYTSAAVSQQFPGRSSIAPDNGVTVSGASNIAFSADSTTYSKNSQTANESPAKSYYSEAEVKVAILDLNPIGDKVGEFTPLGINALNNKDEDGNNSSVAKFDLLAVIDANAIYEQIEDYYSAEVTVTLKQKQNDGSYGNNLTVSDYIDAFTVERIPNGNITNNGTYFSVALEKEDLNDQGSAIVIPVLHFAVITGARFEEAGLEYGNFRITVSAVLKDSGGNEYSVSRVSNFVIYTNAKIIPDYIT